MPGFALVASTTPGPVNVIGVMTGGRNGTSRALAFVIGLIVFAALFGVICSLSLTWWAGRAAGRLVNIAFGFR